MATALIEMQPEESDVIRRFEAHDVGAVGYRGRCDAYRISITAHGVVLTMLDADGTMRALLVHHHGESFSARTHLTCALSGTLRFMLLLPHSFLLTPMGRLESEV